MTPRTRLCWLGLSIATVVGLPARAHHSHGNYDVNNYTLLEGTVSDLLWINPHSWIYLEVQGTEGEPAVWALEGGAPGDEENEWD